MINIPALAILLKRLVHRRLCGKAVGEWSYVCSLSGEERWGRAEILRVVRNNTPEGEAGQFQLGNT